MRRAVMGVLLASTMLLAACGGNGGSGTMEITENGTYDVSGYDQVIVAVGENNQDVEGDSSEPAADEIESLC